MVTNQIRASLPPSLDPHQFAYRALPVHSVHDCTPSHPSNAIKFTDDNTIVCLMHEGDESVYRDEILNLAGRTSANILDLNSNKTEIIIDFRRHNILDLQGPLLVTPQQ